MVLRGRLFFLGVFLLFSCSNEQIERSEQTSDAPENIGKVFFNERCIQCHGFDGTDCLAGAADLNISSMGDDSIRLIIQNGKNAMPPFKSFVESDEELNELIEYVKSLRE